MSLVRNQRGQLMPTVLGLLVVVTIISASFASYVGARQRLARHRYDAMAARYLAEAAVARALWTLQAGTGEKSSSVGSLYSADDRPQGTFAIEAVQADEAGIVTIVARGESGGVARRIKVRATLAPRVLTYGLFGHHLVRFEGAGARTYILPEYDGRGCAEGGHLGSNGEVWFATPGPSVNSASGARLPLRDGEVTDRDLLASEGRRAFGKLLLPSSTGLTFGADHVPVSDLRGLSALGAPVDLDLVVAPGDEDLPQIDRDVLRRLARANVANADLNEIVGSRSWPALRDKRDSSYQWADFVRIVDHLRHSPADVLRGPVFVEGPVVVPQSVTVRLRDGFLAVEGSLTVGVDGRLEILHTPGAHRLPAIMTLGDSGLLVLQQRAVLVADGLVYADRVFTAGQGAFVDVKGAIVAADLRLSIHILGATTVIHYDRSVVGTVGVRRPVESAGTVVRILSWEELR